MPNSIKEKTWKDTKHLVETLNPKLYEVLESIGIDDEPVYEVSYRFGETIGDESYFYLPGANGQLESFPVAQCPYMILLDREIELYLETKNRLVPEIIYRPGNLIPTTVELYLNRFRPKPTSPFKLVAGARNISMMPMTKDSLQFQSLKKKYDLSVSHLENVANHFQVFKSIADRLESTWDIKLLTFGFKFKEKLNANKSWYPLKIYLYEQSLRFHSFNRNARYLDYAVTEIMTDRNLNIRPFTVELIKKILFIALGAEIGFKPLCDETLMPIHSLTKEFIAEYKPVTTPIFIGPTLNNFNGEPVYLPINYFEHSLSDPKKFRVSYYLQEVLKYIKIFLEDFTTYKLTQTSVYGKLSEILDLKFYSERGSDDLPIYSVKLLSEHDSRFQELEKTYGSMSPLGICAKSPFSKALISIKLSQGEI